MGRLSENYLIFTETLRFCLYAGNTHKNKMKTHTDPITTWRRRPFKSAIARAYSDGVINSHQMHNICARIDKVPPFWLIDKHGFPIERFSGRPVKSAFRVFLQNVRKVFGI